MSDILIRGMEMPKSCGYCFALDDYGDYPVCQITKEQRGYNFPIAVKRMDNCPLVPVPPHGRLIDADALIREHRADNYDFAIYACDLVQNAPTVLEAEEGET